MSEKKYYLYNDLKDGERYMATSDKWLGVVEKKEGKVYVLANNSVISPQDGKKYHFWPDNGMSISFSK